MNHFGVTLEDLKTVIAAALAKGGDFADLYFEHTQANNISLRDGQVNRVSSDVDFGVGIRVLKGDQTGYAYTETLTLKEMLKAAKAAATIAEESKICLPINVTEKKFHNYYPVQIDWSTITIEQKAAAIQQLNDRIFELDERVLKVMAGMADSSTHILYFNSEGTLCSDFRPMMSLAATCIMEQAGQIESSSTSRSYRKGFEYVTPENIEMLAQETVQKTAVLFGAKQPVGGEMPVVMAAGGSGILLHEAIGHAFEADFNRKNISIFSDKLGKKICNEQINVVDDGTIVGNRGAVNMDDEGIAGQKTYIVKEGILNSYLHDRISAKHYGVAATGNGRRESFRFAPVPRMRATYMENGVLSEDDLIASVKRGIYCDTFTNGEVQIGAGDFTFFVKHGYMIENGKRTQSVKDINIIGNGPQALADITMVANNYTMDDGRWTCGKSGQSCPVTCGIPAILVKKLTVGGE
ncbi:MAG: TldD/PmbA family protein [Bacteroidales bacterium]|nr:TldD/PmbA family protein [Bacteroidales bacterium]